MVTEARAALDQVDRLTSSVGDMVRMSRAERSPQGTIDVRAELTPLLADLAPSFDRAGRRLTVLPPDGPPLPARATATRVREATAVLVDNALMHGRGVVVVRLGSVGAHTVLITVTDEGSGISDGDAQRIFRRGYSAGDGTGVGLALARAFVEADGGRLQLQSRKPTAFAIFLPAAAPDVQPEPPAREPEPR